MIRQALLIAGVVFSSLSSAAPTKDKPEPKIKNRAHNFDSQVVEGEVYRPDYSVVTGDAPGEGWGVLRLRPDFDDHSTSDGQEKQESNR